MSTHGQAPLVVRTPIYIGFNIEPVTDRFSRRPFIRVGAYATLEEIEHARHHLEALLRSRPDDTAIAEKGQVHVEAWAREMRSGASVLAEAAERATAPFRTFDRNRGDHPAAELPAVVADAVRDALMIAERTGGATR